VNDYSFQDIQADTLPEIRTAVLDGDIDQALQHTQHYYPNVLHDNDKIYFKLRCRKFIEMIRQASQLNEISERRRGKKPQTASSNGHVAATEDYANIFDHQMELDEQLNVTGSSARFNNGEWDNNAMDPEDVVPESEINPDQLLTDTIQYGSELRSEFASDASDARWTNARWDVKRELEDVLALICYLNPNESKLKDKLEVKGRALIAEDLNSAILGTSGVFLSALVVELFC
jgi:hypothetical protein